MKPTLLSGIIVLVLAGHLGYHTVYLPYQHKVRELQEQFAKQRQTHELQAKLAKSFEALEQLRTVLAAQPDTEWLVRAVGELAEEAGLQLTSIVPQSPKILQEFTRLSVNLQLVTSYHQLGKFISLLERSKSFLKVDDLDIARREEGMAQVRMTVSTLYVPSLSSSHVPQSPAGQPTRSANAEAAR